MLLFHYTSSDIADKILDARMIRMTPSNSRYAHFGQGVYLTSLRPNVGRRAIAANNRAGRYNAAMLEKTEYFFAIHEEDLPGRVLRCEAGDRDVYIYRSNIDLDDVHYNHQYVARY